MVLVLGGGVFATTGLDRQLLPNVDLKQVVVTVPYPGANLDEVDASITRRVEERLQGIEGASRVTARSVAGTSTVVVDVEPLAETAQVLEDVSRRRRSHRVLSTARCRAATGGGRHAEGAGADARGCLRVPGCRGTQTRRRRPAGCPADAAERRFRRDRMGGRTPDHHRTLRGGAAGAWPHHRRGGLHRAQCVGRPHIR